jgi:hypothetical protein
MLSVITCIPPQWEFRYSQQKCKKNNFPNFCTLSSKANGSLTASLGLAGLFETVLITSVQ